MWDVACTTLGRQGTLTQHLVLFPLLQQRALPDLCLDPSDTYLAAHLLLPLLRLLLSLLLHLVQVERALLDLCLDPSDSYLAAVAVDMGNSLAEGSVSSSVRLYEVSSLALCPSPPLACTKTY